MVSACIWMHGLGNRVACFELISIFECMIFLTDILNSPSPLVNLSRGGHFPHPTSLYPQPGPIFVPALSYIAPQPPQVHQLCSLGYPSTMDINYFNLYQSYSTVANNTLQSFQQHYSCDSDCRSLPCGYSIQAEETTVNRCLRHHGFSYSPVQVDAAAVPDGSSSSADVCEKSKRKPHIILAPLFSICGLTGNVLSVASASVGRLSSLWLRCKSKTQLPQDFSAVFNFSFVAQHHRGFTGLTCFEGFQRAIVSSSLRG